MIAQAKFGSDRIWSIAIFTAALTINGAVTAGYLGNGLDIAPNFSGKSTPYCSLSHGTCGVGICILLPLLLIILSHVLSNQ